MNMRRICSVIREICDMIFEKLVRLFEAEFFLQPNCRKTRRIFSCSRLYDAMNNCGSLASFSGPDSWKSPQQARFSSDSSPRSDSQTWADGAFHISCRHPKFGRSVIGYLRDKICTLYKFSMVAPARCEMLAAFAQSNSGNDPKYVYISAVETAI